MARKIQEVGDVIYIAPDKREGRQEQALEAAATEYLQIFGDGDTSTHTPTLTPEEEAAAAQAALLNEGYAIYIQPMKL